MGNENRRQYMKIYRANNRNKINAYNRAYRRKDMPKYNAMQRAYRKANLEKDSARQKEWRDNNRDLTRAYARRRRRIGILLVYVCKWFVLRILL